MGEFERLAQNFGWQISTHAKFRNGFWQSEATVGLSYPDESRESIAEIEAQSFWFLHRNRMILKLLEEHGRPVAFWEIGAGNGFVSWYLQQSGIEVVSVEPSFEGTHFAVKRGVRHCIAALLENLCLPDASLPAIGFFDVIEHLKDPKLFLAECVRVLQCNGLVATTVPAFPFLWSQADEDAGHFRRYTRKMLDRAMIEAGLRRVWSGYMMATMLPPLFFLRALPFRMGLRQNKHASLETTVSQLAPKNIFVSKVLALTMRAEFLVNCRLPMPWGTSVLGVYKKL